MIKQLKTEHKPNFKVYAQYVLKHQEENHIATVWYWTGERADIYKMKEQIHITLQLDDNDNPLFHTYKLEDTTQEDGFYIRSAAATLSDLRQRPWNYRQEGRMVLYVGS
jgi:hypothetical protein